MRNAGLPAAFIAEFEPGRARAMRRIGRRAEARAVLLGAKPLLEADPAMVEILGDALIELGRLALLDGAPGLAVEHLRAAVQVHQRLKTPEARQTHAEARAELGRALIADGHADEGRTLLAGALPQYAAWSQADPDDLATLRLALRR
jgi:hypothetical protein